MISKGPERREVRMPGEVDVSGQDVGRSLAEDEINIARRDRFDPPEAGLGLAEFKGARGLTDKHSPALGADYPGDRQTRAKGAEIGRMLAVDHVVAGATPIEWMDAL